MSKTDKPIWGMPQQFNVLLLWGRKTPKALEDFLGEFATLEQAKAFAAEHHQAHKWASYRVSKI